MSDSSSPSSSPAQLKLGLLLLRLGVAAVMIPWSIDKIINPEHTARVFENFYFVGGLDASVSAVLGVGQLAIVAAFLLGLFKKWSYGAILLIHGVATFTAWEQYLSFSLLFYAAWPMLAACIMLYMLRDEDTLYNIGGKA
jgi:putative oxidoreductase